MGGAMGVCDIARGWVDIGGLAGREQTRIPR